MSLWLFLLLSIAINLAGFAAAYRLRTDKITDLSYGLTFIVIAFSAYLAGGRGAAQSLLLGLVVLWAVRLGGFLFVRIRRAGKDKRFDGVREDPLKFLRFWIGQGAAAWVIMLPATYVLRDASAGVKHLAAIGAIVSLAGIIIETTADFQKFIFNSHPANKGRWIQEGLWRYSRHPNYFGEILMWSGTYIYAFIYMTGWERLIALAGPLLITGLLLFVTGIPKLEEYADQKWGSDPDYQDYKNRTSPLLLLPPKNT